jgi:hypothetical protein
MDSGAKLRKVGNQPLAFSSTNPRELLVGFQYLMSTTDGGMHWKKLSPDLGYPKGVAPPAETAPTPPRPAGSVAMVDEDVPEGDEEEVEQQGGPGQGGSIESFSTSSVAPATIWVGTNNGLIKLTKDHGATWEDVTIPGLPTPTRADISAIEACHHDAATAYVAIDLHSTGDYTPYFYRTHDFGKTWTKIVNGLPTDQPSGSFARVIRCDTKKPGLLYAGTESSVYVSFTDGDTWQALALNLPNTSYRDMVVKDNDLVVGTYGRGFWILDDISPLREASPAIATEPAHLFKPGDAIRVRRNVNGDTPFPPEVPHAPNAPVGALIYYTLSSTPSNPITLEIADSKGTILRHMSSAAIPPLGDPAPPVPDFWVDTPWPMPTAVGMSRISWNLRRDNPPAFSHSYEINANPGETPVSPEGPLVLPGVYTLTLTVDGKAYKQTLTVKNDPRSPANDRALAAQHELQMNVYGNEHIAWDAYQQVATMRSAVAEILKASPPSEVADAAKEFDAKLANVGGTTGGGRRFGGGGPGGGSPPPPAFVRVNGAMVQRLMTLDSGDMEPSEAMYMGCVSGWNDLTTALATWKALNANELVAFNAILTKNNLKPIAAAASLPDPASPPKKYVQRFEERARSATVVAKPKPKQ